LSGQEIWQRCAQEEIFMILVDTSVWIDFFGGHQLSHVGKLETLISKGEEIAICGVILTEIFQGIRDKQQFLETEERLDTLILLPMNRSTFIMAAHIYRSLRTKGITIRKSIDCMIAAAALENKAYLLHNDRDFKVITEHFPLKVL